MNMSLFYDNLNIQGRISQFQLRFFPLNNYES